MKRELLEAMYLLGHARYGKRFADPLEGVNIEEEHKLILQKKSGLSVGLRDMVITRYNMLQELKEKEVTKNGK